MVVNKLRRRLDPADWEMTVVDESDRHFYQPGYLFIPFGTYTPEEVVKPRRQFVPDGVNLVYGEIDRVKPDGNEVLLTDGRRLPYDYLVIATGYRNQLDVVPGLTENAVTITTLPDAIKAARPGGGS